MGTQRNLLIVLACSIVTMSGSIFAYTFSDSKYAIIILILSSTITMLAGFILSFMCFTGTHEPSAPSSIQVIGIHTALSLPEASVELQLQDEIALCSEDKTVVVINNP